MHDNYLPWLLDFFCAITDCVLIENDQGKF